MKLLAIKEIFKNETIYYTFRKKEHEMVLLKKLEDNKIFYNNTIYDKDFFYYHKLEGFMEQIYELRDQYIIDNLDSLFSKPEIPFSIKKSIKKTIKNSFNWIIRPIQFIFYWKKQRALNSNRDVIKFIFYDPKNCDEITGLTKAQYDILVKAYKYEFEYNLLFDLLNPSIKFEKNFIGSKVIKDFFYDWFYILGWKSIKPVYPTFDKPLHWHYDDDLYDELTHRNRRVIPDIREKLIFRNRYNNPIDVGTRFKLDWLEHKYDEQKKFDEFDINCKTNTYYTRYIAYNEIYNKTYPEDKKFKTDLIHDFTEEEIKENYENMINKDQLALTKFNFVMFNEKRRNAVLKFFEELEIIEVSKEKLRYDFHWNHEEDSDMGLNKEVEGLIYEVLNNPRYLLVMPLVDAYFEVFRTKGFYHEDDSFGTPPWTDTGAHKKLMKHLMYFDFSYERQYLFAEKSWLMDDYMEIEDVEWDEHYEDEQYAFNLAFGLFIWLVILNFYIVIYWFLGLDEPFNKDPSLSLLSTYSESLRLVVYEEGEVKIRQLVCPEIYYGLELKRPRSRIRTKRIILPLKFYEPGYYSYSKRRAWNMMPFSILERICFDLDEKDFGLNKLHYKLVMHGQSHLIWKLRIPLVEYRYPWTTADPSPIQRLIAWKDAKRYALKNKYFEPTMQVLRPSIIEFRRTYMKPIENIIYEFYKDPIQKVYKEIKISIKDFFNEIKILIKDFFKKPTN